MPPMMTGKREEAGEKVLKRQEEKQESQSTRRREVLLQSTGAAVARGARGCPGDAQEALRSVARAMAAPDDASSFLLSCTWSWGL